MPLLCISLFALLLLPLSLSCGSKRPPEEVSNDYMVIVQTDLKNTRENITALLHNSPCPSLRHNLRRCTSDTEKIVSNLHNLTCRMKSLRLPNTDRLAMSVLNSIRCPCLERPTKEPNLKMKTKKTKNLCKAKEILSNMTECYEMLNTVLNDNIDGHLRSNSSTL
uniref:Interleukin-7 n=1 Tax=Lates calcarifer TaxID=8187 RepID=A0A4W6D0R6_LATCA